ncbi:hypothetical protein FNV43_RR05954 [Rhamnella rubrinervis]|uniref:Uncharacterized protein n=1 Tax=Rhamnella rubrinervis TaxID=2594499 RepID=A0A8K0HCP8_9ROSA|nr:hypothetical protein FNV43_RR05954 [Rhamnella rubrinervis]
MHEHEDVNAIDGSLRQVASSGTNKYGFMEFQPPERVEHVTIWTLRKRSKIGGTKRPSPRKNILLQNATINVKESVIEKSTAGNRRRRSPRKNMQLQGNMVGDAQDITRVLKTISTQMENMEEECNVVVEENGKTEELIDYETINAVNMDDMIYV